MEGHFPGAKQSTETFVELAFTSARHKLKVWQGYFDDDGDVATSS